MKSFEGGLREAFFSGQHTIISTTRPHKKIRHLRQSLRIIDDYLEDSGCYENGHDYYASTTIRAQKIGCETTFIRFAKGTFVIGQLCDYTRQFDDRIIIYACYFSSNPNEHCAQFIAVPPDAKIIVGLGRENGRCYVCMTCKQEWLQLCYETGHAYSCKAKHRKTAHPEVYRSNTEIEIPTIDFTQTGLDEAQQIHKANEKWGNERFLIFVNGQLRLQ